MWIFFLILRLLAAFLGGFFRFAITGASKTGEPRNHEGLEYLLHRKYRKRRLSIMETRLPFRAAKFELRPELEFDMMMKTLGVATEVQTGDKAFDDKVYVLSDNPYVDEALRRHAEVRRRLLQLFEEGYRELVSDGEYLSIATNRFEEPTAEHLEHLQVIKEELAALEVESVRTHPNRFLFRAVLTEAAIYSLAGYAFAIVVQNSADFKSLTLEIWRVVPLALSLTGILLLLFMISIALLFRGSSRGHRVILESLLLLTVSLPVVGFQTVIDVNKWFDTSPPTPRVVTVVEKTVETSGTGTNRKTHYGLSLRSEKSHPVGVDHLTVTYGFWKKGRTGQELVLILREGRLGVPWVESYNWVDDSSPELP